MTCRCGQPITRRGTRGPVPTFCSTRCRQRAWEAKQPKAEPRPKQSIEERRERARAYARAYRQRNRDRIAAYRRATAAQIADYQRQYTARWRRANAERLRQAKRIDGIKRTVGKGHSEVAYAHILRRDPCCYCGAPTDEIDHIVPIAAGGPNDWLNLTAACKPCNARKRDRPLLAHLLTA